MNEASSQLIKVAFTSILRVRLLDVLLKVIFILTLLWPKNLESSANVKVSSSYGQLFELTKEEASSRGRLVHFILVHFMLPHKMLDLL